MVNPEISTTASNDPSARGSLRVALFELGKLRVAGTPIRPLPMRNRVPPAAPHAPQLRRGNKPGSARQIKDTHSRSDASSLEQFIDETPCRLSEGRGIVRCRPLPTGMLEGADGVGVKSHRHASAAMARAAAMTYASWSSTVSLVEGILVYL
jgi:hypothetical protein